MNENLTIDVSGIFDEETLHEYLYKVLEIVPGYGFNFDAFWDVITDDDLAKMPKILTVEGLADLKSKAPTAHAKLMECLKSYCRDMPERKVEFIDDSPSGLGLISDRS